MKTDTEIKFVRAVDLVAPHGPLPVTSRCLQLWALKGIIPGHRVGKTWLFDKEAVLETIRSKKP